MSGGDWFRRATAVQAEPHVDQRGLLEECGDVWDGADRLVAPSRQLALVPRS